MVYNTDEIVKRALASETNDPGTCQLWTREIIGVPSVGDYDHDNASDAEDGWKSEPLSAKHAGDPYAPAGMAVSYLGGSHDNGHRAVSVGNGWIRTTDGNGEGHVATRRWDWPCKSRADGGSGWMLTYAGWSETCDGVKIPSPVAKPSRGTLVVHAIKDLIAARNKTAGQPGRKSKLKKAIQALKSIKPS